MLHIYRYFNVLIVASTGCTRMQVFVVEQKLFTLDFIDEQFKNLNLRLFDDDKPSPLPGLTLTTSDSNVCQHGMNYIHSHMHSIAWDCSITPLSLCSWLIADMQMWTMVRFLSLVIGHKIPEGNEHWQNLLCLLDIMDILFARRIPKEKCGYLEALIHDHHSSFIELYPDSSITMKMHSMVHMPRLILK